ncbi:predicted protein [Naegleria gruberi]|uniref:Predicted protein n=1 Tax=Naegleria gruberi TaxID=5762 RepID=D2V6I3_NAEGR|nr:uncharacterized protein NAEGRDRAFT_64448 [Naegleria gruberi]EFC47578.1 predicted protein [Naegleria gruberi]|eukprot:XP_002680322.1 predicted protein [Naegleria gruberi strain NEG-M]
MSKQVIHSHFEKLGEYVLTKHVLEGGILRKATVNDRDAKITTLRHVIPYVHCYHQKVENYEGRMTNKTLQESYCREYGVDESTFRRMCEMNVITLNEKPITKSLLKYKLKDDDCFQVKDMRMDRPIKHFDKLEIIKEENDFVVVTKPPGICVHPIKRYHKNSLFYMLEHEYAHHFGNDLHCKTIHRLDKETCGVLIVGKTSEGAKYFQKLLKEKQVEKQYIARVDGIVKGKPQFEINDPLVCIQRWDNIFKSISNKEVEKEYREICKKNRVAFQPKPSK